MSSSSSDSPLPATRTRRRPRGPARAALRVVGTAGAAVCAVVLAAAPALAHVTVSSPDAAPGGFGKLVFRVPNESETAGTVKVSVELPTATPFAFVSSKPVPGWEVEQQKTKLERPVKTGEFRVSEAVSRVTWTAAKDTQIGPGEFDEFELSVGPMPERADELSFPTVQTYSDGERVGWDEPVPASGAEPEHPAPVLSLAEDRAGRSAGRPSDGATVEAGASGQPADEAGGDNLSRGLAAGALVLAGAALAVSLRRGRG